MLQSYNTTMPTQQHCHNSKPEKENKRIMKGFIGQEVELCIKDTKGDNDHRMFGNETDDRSLI